MLIWDYWHPSQYNFTENVQDMLARIIIENWIILKMASDWGQWINPPDLTPPSYAKIAGKLQSMKLVRLLAWILKQFSVFYKSILKKALA